MSMRTGEIATLVQAALEAAGINVSVDDIHVTTWQDQAGAFARIPHEVEMRVRVHSVNPNKCDIAALRATGVPGPAKSKPAGTTAKPTQEEQPMRKSPTS